MTPRSSCPGGESTPLQGANLRLNYEINNVTDTALGNLARGKPSFCRSDRCLSYRPPGSLLESRGGSILARAEGVIALALASSLLCLAQTPSKAPSPLCKFAGSWKEDESRRKSSSTITFRRDAQGNLEEVLAYGTLVNPVHFDGKPYSADSLKKTEAIAWKQLDKSHFERTFFDGGKPLGTTRYQISDDGKTLTTASDRTLADGRQNVSTGVFRRTKGEAQGLAATWQQVSFHSSVPRSEERRVGKEC